ncbi:MAG: hypothetical protein MJ059_04255 [Lachnospiraceae bacterium]|nr:hypothetical protein [Lachnospiraceae bacterium]
MAQLNIGWSEVNITPDKKVSLYGQFAERISEYVEKPLMATAMAVECGGDQMVLCACDLESVHDDLIAAIREKLAGNEYGLDENKIIFSAIHTHTGPQHIKPATGVKNGSFTWIREVLETCLAPGQKYVEAAEVSSDPTVATGEEVFVMLVERLTMVCIEAWNARKPGGFSNAFARAAIGMCRRVDYSDGTGQMWGDANTAVFTELEGGNDSGIELMYIFDDAKKLTGIVINLACPAQCVQHRLFVSPDFWGETKVLLRKYFGEDIFMLPLCSPAGDQCPVDLVRWVNPDTDVHDPNLIRHNPPVRKADPSMFDIEGMKKAGKRVAREVIDTFEEGLDEPQTDVKFEHRHYLMQLPLRRATLAQKIQAEKNIKEYIRNKNGADVDFNDLAHLQNDIGILIRFVEQEKKDIYDTEYHCIRMGTVAISSDPFELFLDYANQIKARAVCEQTFLIQLAGGSAGYLPTEKAENHGHYSAFIPSGNVGHVGGDQLVRQTLKDISELFGDDYKVYHYADEQ